MSIIEKEKNPLDFCVPGQSAERRISRHIHGDVPAGMTKSRAVGPSNRAQILCGCDSLMDMLKSSQKKSHGIHWNPMSLGHVWLSSFKDPALDAIST